MALSIGHLKPGEAPFIAGVLTDRDVRELPSGTVEALNIVELRVDLFDSTEPGHVAEVFRTARELLGKPIIATVRDVREGGGKAFDDRRGLYETCIPLCEAVDVEVRALADSIYYRARGIANGDGGRAEGSVPR